MHDSVWVGCQRRPEHWVGTQLSIGSVSLSNTKDSSLTACTVSCEEWGLPMYAYCMCSFACLGFGVTYPPILSGYDTEEFAANSTALLRCFLQKKYIQPITLRLWGKRKWSFLLVISIFCKQSLKCSSVLISRSAVTESIFKKMLEL